MNDQANDSLAKAKENLRVLTAAARSYRDDPEFRAQIESEPRAALAGVGIDFQDSGVDAGLEVQVYANTEDVFHMVMPLNPNTPLSDEAMTDMAGGSTASSAGSAGSGSTVSTPASSLSSAGTAGSAGSATSS